MEHEGNGHTNCNWCTRIYPQKLDKRAGNVGNWRTNRDHQNYWTVKIGQNTEKSLGDLEFCYPADANERPSANDGVKN